MCELTLEQAGQFNAVKERHYKQYLRSLDWADFGQHDSVRRAVYEKYLTSGDHPTLSKQPHTIDWGKEF